MNTHQLRTLSDYKIAQTKLSTEFVSKKIALAAVALYKRGASYKQIADELELTSAAAVSMLMTRYGGAK